MTTQPEALRLADALDAHQFDEPHAAAAELRRLHDDYENALKHFAEAVEGYKQMAAQRDALLEALERIAQLSMSQFHIPYDMAAEACNIASAAIKQAEGKKT